MTNPLQEILERAARLKEVWEKADLPSEMRVDRDYLEYGDSITRPSATYLHRVHLTSANEIDCTTEAAEFFVLAANEATFLCDAVQMLFEEVRVMRDALEKVDPEVFNYDDGSEDVRDEVKSALETGTRLETEFAARWGEKSAEPEPPPAHRVRHDQDPLDYDERN